MPADSKTSLCSVYFVRGAPWFNGPACPPIGLALAGPIRRWQESSRAMPMDCFDIMDIHALCCSWCLPLHLCNIMDVMCSAHSSACPRTIAVL